MTKSGRDTIVYTGAQVPQELRDQIQALADRHDRSVASEIRQALREYVERELVGDAA